MGRSAVLASILVAAAASGCSANRVQHVEFSGPWRSAQPTGGITALQVFEESGGLKVRAWGSCRPVDCQWETADFVQLPDAEGKSSDRGFARWDGRYVVFRFEGNYLLAEQYRVPEGEMSGAAPMVHYGVARLVRGS